MKIEINNRTKQKIDTGLIKKVINEFVRCHKVKQQEISIALTSDQEIKKLNETYRGKNEPTDILSFAGEGDFFGELVLDYNQIKRQAGKFGNNPEKELVFILVHGLLHLLGDDDESERDRQAMIKRGEEFINKLKK